MSEHLAAMNERLTQQKDEIDILKYQLEQQQQQQQGSKVVHHLHSSSNSVNDDNNSNIFLSHHNVVISVSVSRRIIWAFVCSFDV